MLRGLHYRTKNHTHASKLFCFAMGLQSVASNVLVLEQCCAMLFMFRIAVHVERARRAWLLKTHNALRGARRAWPATVKTEATGATTVFLRSSRKLCGHVLFMFMFGIVDHKANHQFRLGDTMRTHTLHIILADAPFRSIHFPCMLMQKKLYKHVIKYCTSLDDSPSYVLFNTGEPHYLFDRIEPCK